MNESTKPSSPETEKSAAPALTKGFAILNLIAQEPGGMCQYKVFLSGLDEVDAELAAWLRQAYDRAG